MMSKVPDGPLVKSILSFKAEELDVTREELSPLKIGCLVITSAREASWAEKVAKFYLPACLV